ncbi:FadR family transcriptional regulator [Paracoccus gahaiensis]|uniref:FadR family transcriptional regulator n=1 Tax=Paracoccus gahaiensis TaxID=1706839 RepID=A0A4U0R8K7_9RHOB|nr:GntR family transcriptional regulator [Paracoccus gahaiensis]TJZ91355.1 FadR family transcriptional regulator [Paracoccus gahaiensis]
MHDPVSNLPAAAGSHVPATGPTVRRVVEQLVAHIRQGDLAPGSRLPAERLLARDLGVARNTLREALDQLERQGLIDRRLGAGTFVTGAPEPGLARRTGPLHLHVMRGILEPEIARLAIMHMPQAGLDQLAAQLDLMSDRASPADFAQAEQDFLSILAESSANPLLLACYRLVLQARREAASGVMLDRHLTSERRDRIRAGHGALLQAIELRDMAEAQAVVQQMLLDEQALFTQGD